MTTVGGAFRFRRNERIDDPEDFRRVMKTGRKIVSRNFILFVKNNERNFHRLGVVVSKEVGPATYRNRIKRVCRECFRLHKPRIKGAVDIVILTKKGCNIRDYKDAKDELQRALVL